MISVQDNQSSGLCCSCGICKAICPKKAISFQRDKGMYVPHIDNSRCINCGLCSIVCPGFCQDYSANGSEQQLERAAAGKKLQCWNAWSRDDEIRFISASGGVTTTIIYHLLDGGYYDGVFCVDTYCYDTQIETSFYDRERYCVQKGYKDTVKSRYLPVSHEKTVSYMCEHPEKRLIIVAVPCAIKGILRSINLFHLRRENYLLLGLFCQKQFEYNFTAYLASLDKRNGSKLCKVHFKNKESGNWPGDMKLHYDDHSSRYFSSSIRVNAKNYFQPERCLYCIDKLAVDADISLGDNYTGIEMSDKGSNSVIIRSEAGETAWALTKPWLRMVEVDFHDILNAEDVAGRLEQFPFGRIKRKQLQEKGMYAAPINRGISENDDKYSVSIEKQYHSALEQLRIGQNYLTNPKAYPKALKAAERKSLFTGILQRVKRPGVIAKSYLLSGFRQKKK